jgi:hypothetical protein
MGSTRVAFPRSVALVLLSLVSVGACGGRSIGVPDPGGDGGAGPDSGWPVDLPDAAIIPDAAIPPDAETCEHSPLQGEWSGTFTGEAVSPLMGVVALQGTVNLEIYCSEVLLVRGEMTGSEQSGASFEADIDGEYDSAMGQVRAGFDGWVESVPMTGTLQGWLWEGDVDRIEGTWEGEAPDVDGTGSGHWQVWLF